MRASAACSAGYSSKIGRAADAEIALDALHQHAAENIAPAVVGGDADAGALRRAREQGAVGLAVRQRRQQIDAGEFFERFRHRQPFRRQRKDRLAAAKAELLRARRLAPLAPKSRRSRPSASDKARPRDTIRPA